jgi:hypothetical protein
LRSGALIGPSGPMAMTSIRSGGTGRQHDEPLSCYPRPPRLVDERTEAGRGYPVQTPSVDMPLICGPLGESDRLQVRVRPRRRSAIPAHDRRTRPRPSASSLRPVRPRR